MGACCKKQSQDPGTNIDTITNQQKNNSPIKEEQSVQDDKPSQTQHQKLESKQPESKQQETEIIQKPIQQAPQVQVQQLSQADQEALDNQLKQILAEKEKLKEQQGQQQEPRRKTLPSIEIEDGQDLKIPRNKEERYNNLIKGDFKDLEKLQINFSNAWSSRDINQSIEKLGKKYPKNLKILIIDLQMQNITPKSLDTMLQGLPDSLQQIQIQLNNSQSIDDDIVDKVTGKLPSNIKIIQLNISNCMKLTDKIGSILAKNITNLKNLEALDINIGGNANISDKFVLELSPGLNSKISYRNISCWGSQLTEKGWQTLSILNE